MADESARVALKCIEAKDTLIADLSDCKLIQVPPAFFVILANFELTKIDLSHNPLKKINANLARAFPLLKDFRCSHTASVSQLPDEFASLKELSFMDLSNNSFVSVPKVPPSLERLNLSNNLIKTLTQEDIEGLYHMQEIVLTGNELDKESKFRLSKYGNFLL